MNAILPANQPRGSALGTKGRMTYGCVTLNPMTFGFLCFSGSLLNFLSIKEGGKRSITVNREIRKAVLSVGQDLETWF